MSTSLRDSDQLTAGPTLRAGFAVIKLLIRPNLGIFVASVAGAIVFAAGSVASAVALGWVVDTTVLPMMGGQPEANGLDAGKVVVAVAALVGIAFTRAVGVVARRYFAGMSSERAERHLRDRLGNVYVDAPLSWRRRHPTGKLLAHVDADARMLVEMLHPLPFSVGVVFIVIFGTIALMQINLAMALIAVVIFATMFVANRIYSILVEEPMSSAQAYNALITTIAHESFEGAMMVKTLGRAEAEQQRFFSAADSLRVNRIKLGRLRTLFDESIDFVPTLGTLAAIAIGASQVAAGTITPGDLVKVGALFGVLGMPMRVFGFFLESMPPSQVAWARVRDLVADTWWTDDSALPVSEPQANDCGDDSRSDRVSRRPASSVRLSSVEYHHPDAGEDAQKAIDNVSLSIDPGEVVAVVGPTGSGKSTLMLLIAGLLEPDSGSVTIDDRPATLTLDTPSRPAVVFQEPFLFGDTITANIDLHGHSDLRRVEQAASAAKASSFIDELPMRYQTKIGERGVTLSGGQRQRIAIARALLQESPLLILDDATSAVDPVTERSILDRLSEVGATMIVVAHRLSTIARADRVIYMRDGTLLAVGRHSELMNRADYATLAAAYSSQAAEHPRDCDTETSLKQ